MLKRTLTIFCWAGCLLLVTACATTGNKGKPKLNAQQLQKMAENYLAAGDTGLALQCLTEAEKMKPSDPTIQYDFGLAFGARGLPDEALARFEKALALKPDYAEAANALGALYAQKGQLEKAEAAFQKALANPFYQTPFYALYNLGRIDERRGNLRSALERYNRAVELQAAYAPAYLRIGVVQEALGHPEQALQSYERALQYSPNMVEALLRIGILYYQAGDPDKASDTFAQVLRMSPDSDSAAEAKRYLQKLPGGNE